jgi:hypothetical protein
MKMADLCYVMLRGVADNYQHFGLACSLRHHIRHSVP